MKLFNKVAILGVGLIGGSIGLCIKNKRLANEVIGVTRHKKSLLSAKSMGAIDYGSQNIGIIKEADLLVLSAPVGDIINLAPQVSKIIKPACIVTDVGSTKEEIVLKLTKIFPKYVGSHPLAGLEKKGVVNANPNLFKNSLCIMTPVKNTDTQVIKQVKELWIRLGAKIIFLSPKVHDKILSLTSHLPHIAAFSLIDIMPNGYLKFSSAGLKDTTRIAGSDSQLWSDIFLSNRKNVLKAIGLLQNELVRIRAAIKSKDKELLSKILKKAREKRNRLN